MDIEKRVSVITCGVKYRASRRYHEGRYNNPYGTDVFYIVDPVKKAMWEIYHSEMKELLLRPNCCPYCNQPYNGDFDW